MTQAMGDLESGFEVVDGVRLGYLIIKGKQMFALSQVFTDLLKNIPRTTVHKRMDHLQVKKHHCDLEELRKLKAINSIAFHAAKCTLISREDVEALNTSCKTERVLKTKRRRISRPLSTKEPPSPDPYSSLWKENKVWLGLNESTKPIKRKAFATREPDLLPAADLPHFLSKYTGHSYPQIARSPCKTPGNYETPQIPGECVAAFHSSLPYFRGVLCSKHPAYYYQPAIAQPKLGSSVTYRYKRKRSSADKDSSFHSSSSSNSRRFFFLPKPYRSKGTPVCLERIHLVNGFCTQHLDALQEGYSSDSESSSAANDSDFGSSLSSSSNSVSSEDEEEEGEEEEGSLSDSSDLSSDEDSSSESDSSSVSSQVSVESIRFRRTSFSSPVHIMAQSNLLCQIPRSPSPSPGKTAHCEIKSESQDWSHHDFMNPGEINGVPGVGGSLLDKASGIHLPLSAFSCNAKRSDMAINCVTQGGSSPSPKKNNVFPPQQRINWESKQSTLSLLCVQKSATSPSSSSCCVPATTTERGDTLCKSPGAVDLPENPEQNPNSGVDLCTDLAFMHNVKIKIEDSSGHEEYHSQHKLNFECNVAKDELDSDRGEEDKTEGALVEAKQDSVCTDDNNNNNKQQTTSGDTMTPSEEDPPCTLDTHNKPEDGDYKYGAKVRKNYRTLVLGKRPMLQTTPCKPNLKSARSPRPPGPCC
ncbi:SKI/DACH domain-containing protein 1 [Dendrobates tinctorius]|uniref:SKI/DACH domain-containing protein 1 n=1 Tax=Dendrobates tinctorius TaxID=92724 RepID=UPI003CCA5320